MGEPRDGAPPRQSNEGNAVEPSSQNTPLIAGESQRASGEGVSTAGALGMPNTTKANHLTHMTESVPRGGRDGGSTGRGDAEGRRRAASVFRGPTPRTNLGDRDGKLGGSLVARIPMARGGKFLVLVCLMGGLLWLGIRSTLASRASEPLDKVRAPVKTAGVDSSQIYPPHEGPPSCGSPWSSGCFDRSRCLGAEGTPQLSMYVHDGSCSNMRSADIMAKSVTDGDCGSVCNAALALVRQRAKAKGLLAETPGTACLIVYGLRTGHRCVSRTPTWENGRNHLIIDFNDQQRYAFPDVFGSVAMFASSNMQSSYYRAGYDIALPLPPKKVFEHLAVTPPMARKYFLTFKGHFYMSGGGFTERGATLQIAAESGSPDVVIVENCQESHKEHLLPENLEHCEDLMEKFSQQDYADLMNTTFALVPAGRSPATFRLGEVLSAGAIPVFLHKSFVKPFPSRIPWHLCSFSFPIEEASTIIETLRGVPEQTLEEMKTVCLQAYNDYFKGRISVITDTTLDILDNRLAFRSERP